MRRRLLAAALTRLATLTVVTTVAAGTFATARAQSFPARPIRLICPFPPAGAVDIASRATADELTKILGQPVTVENKPGAGGNLGGAEAARAAPGVKLVLTGEDVRKAGFKEAPPLVRYPGRGGMKMLEPHRDALAVGRVRHVGQEVALIVADSPAAAQDAAEAIAIEGGAARVGWCEPSMTSARS